jgi:hydrogenase maturation protease
MNQPRILIAGIGNIFLGDDAFGVEVTQRLLRRTFPADVRVVDFGIRGLDLTYAILDGYETVILIDAVPRGDGPPGTLYLLEPQLDEDENGAPQMDAHSMDPVKVLQAATAMGARPKQIYIVGCEPMPMENIDDGETPMEMSPPVSAAVDRAVNMIESLIEKLLNTSEFAANLAPVPSPGNPGEG